MTALRPCSLLLVSLLLLVGGGSLAAEDTPLPQDLPIDAAGRTRVIDGVLRQLKTNIYAPEQAAQAEKVLRRRQKEGAYNGITSSVAFAQALDQDLRPHVRDAHFGVRFSPRTLRLDRPLPWNLPPLPPEQVAQQREELRRHYARINFGVRHVERLDGNVGYLRLTNFTNPELGWETAVAAMRMLAETDALIIDLRGNGGGYDQMAALYIGWLLPKEEHVLDVVWKDRPVEQIRTPSFPPAGRYGMDKEVYVLTDRDTFSAAEVLAYDLQVRGRARLVGETTPGGANSAVTLPADEHFLVSIPMGRTVHAITHSNWEGVGVKPDIAVPASDALRTAHRAALTTLSSRAKSPELAEEIRTTLAGLEERNPPTR